jgi:predicted PurR-regulated permease PerM
MARGERPVLRVLRPLLISGRSPIPFVVVFLGILGGLSAFGVIGIFLGPVLLSVGFTLLNEFARTGLPAEAPAAPSPPNAS